MKNRVGAISEWVCRAQAGDLDAWTSIVEEFQDVAVGAAAGWLGSWALAEDVAQDAFVTAFVHLDELADPQAFPAWFIRVVRSAATRSLRRQRPGPSASDPNGPATDPAELVVLDEELQRLRAAVELLPEHQRVVVTLHYLAGMPYAEVAETLGISVSAAKQRAHSARSQLKEVLPVALDRLAGSRPSRDVRLEDTVALFLGIRQRDHELVGRLLRRDPSLVAASERWSQDEAMELGLQNAEEGTPLVRAVQTGDVELVGLLLDAGADPSLRDDGGRDARDWARRRVAGANEPARRDLLVTGVRAVDLFAPISRGALQWWPAAWELGQFALLTEIVRSIGPDEFWQIGFETGSYNQESGRQWLRQFPVGAHLRLTPDAPSPAERRAHFEATLNELGRSRNDKIVMVLTAPGHHHDVTLALAQTAVDRSVLTTIVIEPATANATIAPSVVPPEGYDAQVGFDQWRGLRQLWPAVDTAHTSAVAYPDERHQRVADAARTLLTRYRAVDPELELRPPDTYPSPPLAAHAQALHRFLVQRFALWEHVTAEIGESTPYDELLDSVEAMLGEPYRTS